MSKKIVCFGDSITESGAESKIGVRGWTDWLQTQLGVEHTVINAGVGANTSMHALDRLASDVLEHRPDIVLIEFGINDAYVYVHQSISRQSVGEYERNMREILRIVRESGAQPVLVINHLPVTGGTVHQQGNGKSIEENMVPYNAVLEKLVTEFTLSTVDFPARLREDERVALLEEDGIHLSQEGQLLYGKIVLHALRPLLETTPESLAAAPSLT